MMANRAVVEPEGFRELVGVAGPRPEGLEDARAVQAAPGAGDQKPQELTQGRAHNRRRA